MERRGRDVGSGRGAGRRHETGQPPHGTGADPALAEADGGSRVRAVREGRQSDAAPGTAHRGRRRAPRGPGRRRRGRADPEPCRVAAGRVGVPVPADVPKLRDPAPGRRRPRHGRHPRCAGRDAAHLHQGDQAPRRRGARWPARSRMASASSGSASATAGTTSTCTGWTAGSSAGSPPASGRCSGSFTSTRPRESSTSPDTWRRRGRTTRTSTASRSTAGTWSASRKERVSTAPRCRPAAHTSWTRIRARAARPAPRCARRTASSCTL